MVHRCAGVTAMPACYNQQLFIARAVVLVQHACLLHALSFVAHIPQTSQTCFVLHAMFVLHPLADTALCCCPLKCFTGLRASYGVLETESTLTHTQDHSMDPSGQDLVTSKLRPPPICYAPRVSCCVPTPHTSRTVLLSQAQLINQSMYHESG
jgi:hypothetical protein